MPELKPCAKCNQLLPLTEFHRKKDGAAALCKTCYSKYEKEWYQRPEVKNRIKARNQLPEVKKHHAEMERALRHRKGLSIPMDQAKESSQYLGVYIAEKVLSKFFDNIQRMPYGHPGFDYICGKGFKIDVKSSCKLKNKCAMDSYFWSFQSKRNKIADYFLCLAFDNRENLNPLHVWLIPTKVVNDQLTFSIFESKLEKWAQYERPLDKVIACCNQIKSSSGSV